MARMNLSRVGLKQFSPKNDSLSRRLRRVFSTRVILSGFRLFRAALRRFPLASASRNGRRLDSSASRVKSRGIRTTRGLGIIYSKWRNDVAWPSRRIADGSSPRLISPPRRATTEPRTLCSRVFEDVRSLEIDRTTRVSPPRNEAAFCLLPTGLCIVRCFVRFGIEWRFGEVIVGIGREQKRGEIQEAFSPWKSNVRARRETRLLGKREEKRNETRERGAHERGPG